MRKRPARFKVHCAFDSANRVPKDGTLTIYPDGVVEVRQARRRKTWLSTLDGIAVVVIWKQIQRETLERAREKATVKREADKDRRLRREMRAARRAPKSV